jgi:hypothetical protein
MQNNKKLLPIWFLALCMLLLLLCYPTITLFLYGNGFNIPKGSVGVIARGVYIFLDRKRNTLEIAKQEWQGKESSKKEIVFTDGKGILKSLDGVEPSKVIMVVFTPSEVQFVDLSNYRSGKYKRNR